MDLAELDRRLVATVPAFPAPTRHELVRIRDLLPAERATEIGRLHSGGAMPQLAELLIDLEEDERVRRLVLSELRRRDRA